jgi:hypothetical protein
MIMMILSFILAIVSVVLAAASLLNLIVSYDSDYSDKYRTKCFYLSLGCAILSIAIGYASYWSYLSYRNHEYKNYITQINKFKYYCDSELIINDEVIGTKNGANINQSSNSSIDFYLNGKLFHKECDKLNFESK